MPFIHTSVLRPYELRTVEARVQAHPLFRLYLDAALEALTRGINNRSFLIGRSRTGLVASIDFDTVTIRTTIGDLADDELAQTTAVARRAELHLEPAHLDRVTALLAGRVASVKHLRYYRRDAPTGFSADPRCRPLGPPEATLIESFFRTHYPATIFSAWMLDTPFIGLFEDGDLRACGGVVVWSRALGLANIGNFLTDPGHRCRGLAHAVARSLIHRLEADRIRLFLIGTNEENVPAWRVYEELGFRLIEVRPQLDVAAPRPLDTVAVV